MIYEDFGHKITGAKKDNEVYRHKNNPLYKQALKSHLWPKPKMSHDDIFIDYLIEKFRECIRAQMYTFSVDQVKEFIKEVTEIKTLMEAAQTENDIFQIIEDVLTLKNQDGSYVFNQDLLFYKHLKLWMLTRTQMKREFYGLSFEEKIKHQAYLEIQKFKVSDFINFNTTNSYLLMNTDNNSKIYFLSDEFLGKSVNEDLYVICDKDLIIRINATYEDYLNLIRQKQKEIEQEVFKRNPRLKYKHLENVIRSGDNYRNNEDITTEKLQKLFSFYGGQFGNCATRF